MNQNSVNVNVINLSNSGAISVLNNAHNIIPSNVVQQSFGSTHTKDVNSNFVSNSIEEFNPHVRLFNSVIPSYQNKSIIIPDLSTNLISVDKIENMEIFCDIMVLGNSTINNQFTSNNYLTIPNSMNQF